MDAPGAADHPEWTTFGATLVSYGLVLAFLFLLLFVVPYLVVSQGLV